MKTQAHSCEAPLQWEGLQSPCKVTHFKEIAGLLSGSNSAIISRDDSYHLRCEVEGFSSDLFAPCIEYQRRYQENTIGPFDITGLADGYTVSIAHCYLTGVQAKPGQNHPFASKVQPSRVNLEMTGPCEETAHIDWFLNGPRNLVFHQRTFYQRDFAYSRKVEGHEEFTLTGATTLPGGSADCAVVCLPEFSFLLRAVPEEFGPSWSKNVAIEYNSKVGPIPDAETREAVSEIVSFVLGRRLIRIGDTGLTTQDFCFNMQSLENVSAAGLEPVKVKPNWAFQLSSRNPWAINVRDLCSKLDYAPIPIERLHREQNQHIEAVLTKLVPIYLQHRRALALDHALWRYWIFQELPHGFNLPMLVNGLEILAKAWFASPSSPSQGNFVPKSEFLSILETEISTMRAKLAAAAKERPALSRLRDQRGLDALMRRVENSFEMGQNAKLREFFQELGVIPTNQETEALNARHVQVHSHDTDGEPRQLWHLSESLRTLFYKTLLCLLDYSGEYLDWSEREPVVKVLNPN
jgi:hypothetical protein